MDFDLTPGLVGIALNDTIKKYKSDKYANMYPETKIAWIKKLAYDMLDLLEHEGRRFNSESDTVKIVGNDYVSALTASLNVVLKQLALKPKKN